MVLLITGLQKVAAKRGQSCTMSYERGITMKSIAVLLFAILMTCAGSVYAEEAAEKSQAINAISYDADAKSLTVEFDRGTYVYSEVPADVYESLKNSDSQGTYYRENIKGKYPSTKKQDE